MSQTYGLSHFTNIVQIRLAVMNKSSSISITEFTVALRSSVCTGYTFSVKILLIKQPSWGTEIHKVQTLKKKILVTEKT